MSVSGIGGNSSWFSNWATLGNTNPASAAQKTSSSTTTSAASAASTLGQEVAASSLGTLGLHSVTGASGQQMNSQDSSSFGQTISSLTQSLQNGDLKGAQDAYAKLAQLTQSAGVHGHHHHRHHASSASQTGSSDSSSATSASQSADPFAQAFSAIGQSLQNGDLTGAKSAMAQLDSLLQGAQTKLTSPPIGADSPANPAGGIVNLTA
jgi:hypothetical protein